MKLIVILFATIVYLWKVEVNICQYFHIYWRNNTAEAEKCAYYETHSKDTFGNT